MAKILIVDDDVETAQLFQSIIKSYKHEPLAVTDSRNAIKAVQNFQPDLILLDIMMAYINGITLCKLIKSDPVMQKIPVMMISALSDEGSKRDAANAGADDFLVKPVSPKLFLSKINELLKRK